MLDESAYAQCRLCPRSCAVDRTVPGRRGVCGQGSSVRIARAALHYWEEPPISGEAGSGAIFFSGCPLGCVFCQNHQISSEGFGREVSQRRLAKIMLELQDQGALNINLVTALHFAPQVAAAVALARNAGLSVPVLCNTSGYERPELIAALDGVVDVWLADFKYASPRLAARYSAARNYPEVAAAALAQMVAQTEAKGGRLLADDGSMLQGVVVRHLVMPGSSDDSLAVLDRAWEIGGNSVDLSVMNQYTPNAECRAQKGDLSRSVTDEEYERVLDHADALGFERMWWQQGGTVSESFVPEFDDTGVAGPEL
ncbi:radical SAM protein [Atopobiaceae bacterium 24-176]